MAWIWFRTLIAFFKKKWKSYFFSLVLAASIATSAGIVKDLIEQGKKLRANKSTIVLLKTHGTLISSVNTSMERLVNTLENAKKHGDEADRFIAQCVLTSRGEP